MSNIKLCSLTSANSVKNFVLEHFDISKQKLKSFNLSKKFLERELRLGQELELPLALVNQGQINPHYIGPEINIIYEDESFIVLNKPSGIHTHPLHYDEQNNCLSFLRSQGKGQLLEVNKKNYDRGFIHRLDLGTSGILIYAKKEADWNQLRDNFHSLMKVKKYQAIVSGRFSFNGDLVTSLVQTPGKEKVEVGDETGRECEASFRYLGYSPKKDLSLVEIELKTGFRHQIRAQLQVLKTPVLGDELYGGIKAERLYLHAQRYELSFKEKNYQFESLSGFDLLLNFDGRL